MGVKVMWYIINIKRAHIPRSWSNPVFILILYIRVQSYLKIYVVHSGFPTKISNAFGIIKQQIQINYKIKYNDKLNIVLRIWNRNFQYGWGFNLWGIEF
jgi:hypothetical protein